MDLDRLAVRLRPRSDWEALDLGFAMIRNWWRSVYGAWLPVALPVAVASILLFGGWGFLLFWWILPLFEGATLTVLSRTVFGDAPPLAEVLRQAPRGWLRLLREATWGRLDTRRSFHLPVRLLEGSSGEQRRSRIRVLEQGTSDASAWLGLAFFCFALGLTTAVLTAVVTLTPPWLGVDWELIDQQMDSGQAPWAWKGFFLVWAVAILLLDPIYVACGFCLYLSRRTELEGWDLEIAFRSLARRLRRAEARQRRAAGKRAGKAAGRPTEGRSESVAMAWLLGAALLALAGLPGDAAARESAEAASQKAPSEVIAEVMQREELRTEVEVERWQLRSDLEWPEWLDFEDSGDDEAWSFDGDVVGALLAAGAKIFEILLWLGLALVVLIMVREMWRGAPRPSHAREKKVSAPERIVGLDVRRESLPPDVAAAAAELWREGRRVEALGLLYRAALSRLHGEGVELRESFTEADCLAVARRFLTSERSHFFAALTAAWQTAAYAHRLPETAEAEALFAGWRRSFDTGAATMTEAAGS